MKKKIVEWFFPFQLGVMGGLFTGLFLPLDFPLYFVGFFGIFLIVVSAVLMSWELGHWEFQPKKKEGKD